MNSKTFKVVPQSFKLPALILLGGLFAAAFAQDNPEPAKPAATPTRPRTRAARPRSSSAARWTTRCVS